MVIPSTKVKAASEPCNAVNATAEYLNFCVAHDLLRGKPHMTTPLKLRSVKPYCTGGTLGCVLASFQSPGWQVLGQGPFPQIDTSHLPCDTKQLKLTRRQSGVPIAFVRSRTVVAWLAKNRQRAESCAALRRRGCLCRPSWLYTSAGAGCEGR